ncbi:membrane protein [Pararhizobium polonicum]|uniref:Membrane protein n=1 Tax=Pararhizobium polonicum TaxID=1612624 RepID=A0A1C7P383_9HYPH|nr:DMT family transporter [Pararhizobium polonicum]OBZ95732.1 membrane protein [Pararhizobium polonicum]
MNPKKGILLKVLAALCATLMAASIKGLNGAVPTGEVVFFRSICALVPLGIWLGLQGNLIELTATRHFGGHVVRSLSGTGGMFFSYLALAYLPLADATALSYAAPLFTVILAAVLLGEVVRAYRWSSVVIGFSGVLVMLSPHLGMFGTEGAPDLSSNTAAMLGAAAGLLAALFSALSSVQIRHLARTERPGAIVLYFSLMTTVIGLATAIFGWIMPTLSQLCLLAAAGITGGVAQILMTLSLRHALASLLAPFEYSTMLWSVLLGYILLGQLPVATTIAGAIIVAAAGLFAVWREHWLKRSAQLAENALATSES